MFIASEEGQNPDRFFIDANETIKFGLVSTDDGSVKVMSQDKDGQAVEPIWYAPDLAEGPASSSRSGVGRSRRRAYRPIGRCFNGRAILLPIRLLIRNRSGASNSFSTSGPGKTDEPLSYAQ